VVGATRSGAPERSAAFRACSGGRPGRKYPRISSGNASILEPVHVGKHPSFPQCQHAAAVPRPAAI